MRALLGAVLVAAVVAPGLVSALPLDDSRNCAIDSDKPVVRACVWTFDEPGEGVVCADLAIGVNHSFKCVPQNGLP